MENTINLASQEQVTLEEFETDYTQDPPTSEDKTLEEMLVGMDLQKLSREQTSKGFEDIP